MPIPTHSKHLRFIGLTNTLSTSKRGRKSRRQHQTGKIAVLKETTEYISHRFSCYEETVIYRWRETKLMQSIFLVTQTARNEMIHTLIVEPTVGSCSTRDDLGNRKNIGRVIGRAGELESNIVAKWYSVVSWPWERNASYAVRRISITRDHILK